MTISVYSVLRCLSMSHRQDRLSKASCKAMRYRTLKRSSDAIGKRYGMT